jgi:hypothetical protein
MKYFVVADVHGFYDEMKRSEERSCRERVCLYV